MIQNTKKLIAIIYLSIFTITINSCFVGAAIEYTTLAPIESLGITSKMVISNSTFSDYIKILYKMGVSVAVGLAVLMIMWGGIEYITSDALGGKEGGKEKISQALTGLLLALGSFIILKTIDKNLIKSELKIATIGVLPQNINPLTGLPWNPNYRAREGNPYLPHTPEYQNYEDIMNAMIASATGEGVSGRATEFGYRDSEDNGVGSPLLGDGNGRGVLTDDPNVYGVAIPMDVLRNYFNIAEGDNSYASWGQVRTSAVEVTDSNGVTKIVPIVDIGPGQEPVSNGVVIDETHALHNSLSSDEQRTYRIIPNYYQNASDRPVTYTQAP